MDEKQKEQPQNLEGEIYIARLRREVEGSEGTVVVSETEISGVVQLPNIAPTKEEMGVEITEGAKVRPLRSHPPQNPEEGISNLLEWRKRQEKLRKHPKRAA